MSDCMLAEETSYTIDQILEMPYWQWVSFFEYWRDHPPAKEIDRIRHGAGMYSEEARNDAARAKALQGARRGVVRRATPQARPVDPNEPREIMPIEKLAALFGGKVPEGFGKRKK